MGKNLNISIVLYNTKVNIIVNLIKELVTNESVNQIYLIDNSPIKNNEFEIFNSIYIFTGKNLGYGGGNNLAIQKSINDEIKYHLVLNSDIHIESHSLYKLLDYLEENKDVGLIMPKVINEDGSTQLLPKLLPSPIDLLIRVFPFFKRFAKNRSRLYVLADHQNKTLNVPIISGCFSLFRVDTLKKVGLYDEKFFMYFEDFDLSRRIHYKFKTIYYPEVSVIHTHERGAAKSFKLFKIFILSAITYFNKYGWFFDKDRKRINNEVINQIK